MAAECSKSRMHLMSFGYFPPVIPYYSRYCPRGEKNRRLASSISRITESKKEIVFKDVTKKNILEL